MIKVKVYIPLLVLVAGAALAQERDLATVNYAVSRVHYNDTTAAARQLDMKLRFPLYQKKQNTVGATLGYKNVSLQHFPLNYTPILHGLIFQGAWMYKMTKRRSLTLFAQAGLFSDMKDISNRDFRYSAGFRYRMKHSDKLSSGWGLAYSRQFFGNQVVPFIDLDYKPDNRWSIAGQFPVKPKILYRISKKISIGLELSGEAASYRLSAHERDNQFIQINQWTGLSRIEYRFAKAWQFHLGIGRNLKQSYKLFDNTSTTHWTLITIPFGERSAPIQKIDSKGLNVQLGISFDVFEK